MRTPRENCPLWLQLPFPLLILGAGTWYGYYACEHDIGLVLFLLLPLILILALALAVVSTLLVTLMAPRGLRFPVAVVQIILLLFASLLHRETHPLGKWIWEQHVLRPRAAALRQFVPRASEQNHQPVSVAGHEFAACRQCPEGILLYTLELGGPFSSTGIFVPFAADYRGFSAPEEGRPAIARWVSATSVPGLFWFVTRD